MSLLRPGNRDHQTHWADTRGCTTDTIRGVPVGAQIDIPLCTSTGCPLTVTRAAAVVHDADTHGPFATGGGGNVHPAISHGAI